MTPLTAVQDRFINYYMDKARPQQLQQQNIFNIVHHSELLVSSLPVTGYLVVILHISSE